MFNLETKVGFFVLIIILLLVVSLMWLNGSNLFHNGYQIKVEFEHVGGLRPGAPVQMSGVDIGRVRSVELTPKGTVMVHLNIKNGTGLNAGSTVVISTAGVLGEKMIEIIPGEDDSPLVSGTKLYGIEPFSTEKLLHESLDLLSSIKKITASLEDLLSDRELQERLLNTTEDLEVISKNLAAFSTDLAKLDLPTIAANLEQITSGLAAIDYNEINQLLTELRDDGKTSSTIKKILADLEPTASNLKGVSLVLVNEAPNLGELISETKQVLESVNSITEGVNYFLEETASEENAETLNSSLQKAGRVINLADEFLESYDRLSFSNQVSLSTTPNNWELNYYSKLKWGTDQFLLFGWEDFGDRNLLSLQFGLEYQPWHLQVGVLHNWLGMGLGFNYKNLLFQTNLWQPNQPVLDVSAAYKFQPFQLSFGLQNISSSSRHWRLGFGWDF